MILEMQIYSLEGQFIINNRHNLKDLSSDGKGSFRSGVSKFSWWRMMSQLVKLSVLSSVIAVMKVSKGSLLILCHNAMFLKLVQIFIDVLETSMYMMLETQLLH